MQLFAKAKIKAQISCTVTAADQCLCFPFIDSKTKFYKYVKLV